MLLAMEVLARSGHNGDVDITSIIGYIVVGVIVGVLARFPCPGMTRSASWHHRPGHLAR